MVNKVICHEIADGTGSLVKESVAVSSKEREGYDSEESVWIME